MGEIADAILEGSQCQFCGNVFDDACGYPRMCEDCEKDEDED